MLLRIFSVFAVLLAIGGGIVLLTDGEETPVTSSTQVDQPAEPDSDSAHRGDEPAAHSDANHQDGSPAKSERTEPPRLEVIPTADANEVAAQKARAKLAAAQAPGIIEGTLLFAVGGAPAAGARVFLANLETGAEVEGAEDVSNAEGRFRIAPVLPGMYSVLATFKDARLRAEEGAANVAPGQRIDLGSLDVYLGMTITGRVVDIETKNPVARAEVTAWQPGAAKRGQDAYHAQISGPDGSFILAGPFLPGEVILTAAHDLFAPREPPTRVYLETDDITDAEVAVHRAWTLSGRVLTPERTPAPATVELISGSQRICCFETDENGQFSVNDALFRLRLQSAPPSFKIYAYARGDGYRGAFGEFSVDDVRHGISRDVILERGGVVAGRVVAADGTPLSGIRITTWPEYGNRFDNLRETWSTADGSFRIEGLDDGPHLLESQSPAGGLVPSTRSIPFTIDGPTQLEAFEIRYQPGLRISGTAATLSSEAPLTDRLVTLHHPEWLYPREAMTDDEGAFSFDAIPEGFYTVSLRGYSWDDQRPPVALEGIAAGNVDVQFRVEEEPEDGSLEIRVYDADTGRPIADPILLTLLYTRFGYAKNETLELAPDAEGQIVLEGLPRVTLRLVVEAKGYARRQLTASLLSPLKDVATTLQLEAPLHTGRAIGGRVTNAKGYAIEGARIDARETLVPGEELPDGLGTSRIDGTFRLRTVSTEARFLTAFVRGYAPAAANIPPGHTSIQQVRIVLVGGAYVDGRAFYEDDSPATGIQLQLSGSITTHYATTDPDGWFRFEDVEDGPFHIALPSGEPLGSGDVVAASPLEGLELILPR